MDSIDESGQGPAGQKSRHVARLDVIAAAVSVMWLMVFLAFGVESSGGRTEVLEHLGFGWAWLAATGVGLGLSVSAVALNDVLDRRIDRAVDADHAGRAVASGRVGVRLAVGVSFGGLLIALGSASLLGQVSFALTLVLGAGVLFYDLAGRYVPSVGAVTLGLLYGIGMAVPNPWLTFGWPVLLAMTHVMASEVGHHWLQRGKVRVVHVWGALLGWAFWCLVVLVVIRGRLEGAESGLGVMRGLLPGLAVGGFVVAVWWWSRTRPDDYGRHAGSFRRLSNLWILIYGVCWLLGTGLWWQAGVMALGALGLGLWIRWPKRGVK